MVNEVAEIKEVDEVLSYIKRAFPKIHREDFNDEYDSIAFKIAREWLLENGYEAYDFVWDILWKVTDMRLRTRYRKKGK